MTRSAVFVLYYLFTLCAHCRSQGNYIIHTVTPSVENDSNSTTYYVPTESSVKFSRKISSEKSTTMAIHPVYRPATAPTPEDQNEVTQRTNTSSEYSNSLEDRFASTEGSRRPAQTATTLSTDPNKFAVPYTDRNQVFSETVYREKICKNEPTCDMVKLAPEELTSLGTRNCMCDEDCRKYGDCCLDSPHYNATEQLLNYQSFFCSEQELVYMKTKCPEYYTIGNIVEKCANSSQPLASDNVKLAIPVTNPKSKITYGNEYCAQCHNDYDYQSWNFTYYCSEDTFVNTLKIVEDVNETATVNPPIPERDYLWEMNEAAKHVKYDPLTKTFRSTFNNRNYICSYYRFVSESMRQHVRTCIPNIAECSSTADQSLVEKCLSYTAIVYNKNVVYKNKDCASCNGRQRKNTFSGCRFLASPSPASPPEGVEAVYMVNTCPRNFVISSIKDKCGHFDYESADHDLSLMTPVTSTKYKVTFANSYCAICNGLESYDKWQVELKCHSLGPVEELTTPKVSTTSSSSLVIFPGSNRKKRLQVVRKKSVQMPTTEPNAKEAAKYAIYDPKKKVFFSSYNGENFKCVHKRSPTDNLKKSLRYCYPAIDSCSDFSNRTLVEQCKLSATTIVYNKIKYYRNPECALCNKVKDAEPLGCFDLGNRIGASSIFMTGGNKAPPKFCGNSKVC